MTQINLAGKTALITGAAKRVGCEIALSLAREGVNIVVHYNSSSKDAESLCARIKELGAKAWPVKADLENPVEYEGLVARSIEAAGALDILVNNASIFLPSTMDDLTLDSFAQHMQVNAWAPFVLCRDFARKAGRGKIINMLDTRVANFDFAHISYILSKHVLYTLTRMAALEYAPDITVNGISPGLILPPPGQDQAYLERLANTVPLKRHGDPADIANAALYLLKNDFITGEVISVDGGRHLKGTQYGSNNN